MQANGLDPYLSAHRSYAGTSEQCVLASVESLSEADAAARVVQSNGSWILVGESTSPETYQLIILHAHQLT